MHLNDFSCHSIYFWRIIFSFCFSILIGNGYKLGTAIYNFQENTFRNGPFLPFKANDACGSWRESTNVMYFTGGDKLPKNTTFVYDFGNSSNRILRSRLRFARGKHGCYILDREGKLVVAGGVGANMDPVWSIEILDLVSETWSDGRNVLPGSMEISTFHIIDKVWIAFAAGKDNFEEVYRYDSSNDAWDKVTPKNIYSLNMRMSYLPLDMDDLKVCQNTSIEKT